MTQDFHFEKALSLWFKQRQTLYSGTFSRSDVGGLPAAPGPIVTASYAQPVKTLAHFHATGTQR